MENNIGFLGKDFEFKVIWVLLTDTEFTEKNIELLKPEYFTISHYSELFKLIKNYYVKYNKVCSIKNNSIGEFIKLYKKNDETDILEPVLDKIVEWDRDVLDRKRPYDGDVVKEQLNVFIKQQEYRNLSTIIEKNLKSINIDNNDIVIDIEEKIKKIQEIGKSENFGVDLFDDIDDTLSENFRKPITTGIEGLDDIMGGGLGNGEIGVVLAGPGTGKSTLLTIFANAAYTIGKNVLHIVFEDTVHQIKRKHYSYMTKIPLDKMDKRNNRILCKNRLIDIKSKQNLGNLKIVRFEQDETTIPQIKNWVIRYQKKFGIKFDIIILDYIDCIEPHKYKSDKNEAELAIIKYFESMAADLDIPMWTAIQGNRSSIAAEFIYTDQMGGSIKRAQKTHFLMSIAKTPEQKVAGLANIQILKSRFADDGYQFKDCIFINKQMYVKIDERPRKKQNQEVTDESDNDIEEFKKIDELLNGKNDYLNNIKNNNQIDD